MKKLGESITLIIVILFSFISSILFHEFGHCIFYWMQGIPCSMSWVKEFPLQDLSVTQYAIGSWGGIVFNWLLLVLLYFITIWFYKRGKHSIVYFLKALFYGNSIVQIMYALFIIKGTDKTEFIYAQNLLNLPSFSIIIFTLVFTILMLYLFIKKMKIVVKLVHVGFAFLVLILSIFLVSIVENYDSKTNWHKYPAVKVGNEMIYNE
ncbi:MAG: hypothetical protein KOO66_02295 [Bacteroidales bacterium]|nr:hypothetical protein [Bacteroidales bacterium]